jgi:hypothetical protein
MHLHPWRPLLCSLGLVAALAAAPAQAAACCMSASVVGTGRLAVWEDAAAGLVTAWSHGTGRWDTAGRYRPFTAGLLEDELRVDAWGLVRLHERWQLNARVPWVTGVRATPDGTSSLGTGLGDVSAGARWDALLLGEYEHLPGLAVLAQVLGPTGRRPEQATDPLGATATGRGAWAASLGLAAEYATAPWFVRLDLAAVYTAPFVRADTQRLQAFGPGLQAGLSGGREFFGERLVLALALRFEHEFDLWLDGARVDDSASTGLTTTLAASFKLTPRWVLTGAVATDVLGRMGLAQNRQDRLAVTLGVRHGFF